MPRLRKPASPFRYFNSSPDVIRLAVLMYVKYPLSLRNVEDLLHERGVDICHETVRYWWNRFGPLAVRKRRSHTKPTDRFPPTTGRSAELRPKSEADRQLLQHVNYI